jgi:hypothetical protein
MADALNYVRKHLHSMFAPVTYAPFSCDTHTTSFNKFLLPGRDSQTALNGCSHYIEGEFLEKSRMKTVYVSPRGNATSFKHTRARPFWADMAQK